MLAEKRVFEDLRITKYACCNPVLVTDPPFTPDIITDYFKPKGSGFISQVSEDKQVLVKRFGTHKLVHIFILILNG